MNARPIAAVLIALACATSSAALARKLPTFDAGGGTAATLGVPMLVSLGRGIEALADGAPVILDAEAGELRTAPGSFPSK